MGHYCYEKIFSIIRLFDLEIQNIFKNISDDAES